MAYEDLGQSFLPRFGGGGGAEGGSRLEDVLRVLSFRLPRVLGARPIAPAQLLNAQGGQGDPLASAIAQSVIRSITSGSPAGAAAMGSDPGAASPLSQLFAPVLGAGTVQGPADLPTSQPPRVIPVEDEPPARGSFAEFNDIGRQLRRGGRQA